MCPITLDGQVGQKIKGEKEQEGKDKTPQKDGVVEPGQSPKTGIVEGRPESLQRVGGKQG
jgi:hypothetical protein